MANQAFALSPISARASLPGEEDYEAIREAFMETARGRWFLDEYARRNRNADTRMVLDAVAKIEEALAAQKQAPPRPPEDKRPEMLAAIRSAVENAEQTASAALDRIGLEERLTPIRKGARIIKEISWRWREIGADGRICDLLDSQVGAIEAGCDEIAGVDPRTALSEAFDTIKASISAFSDIAEAAPAPAPEETVVEEPAAVTGSLEASADEAEPYDEAMLDRVALEMAAPDFDDADAEFAVVISEAGITEPMEASLAEPSQSEAAEPPQATVAEPQPVVMDAPQVQQVEVSREEPAPVAISPEPVTAHEATLPAPPMAIEPAPSLGATILANGLVTRPKLPANDPLAAIRRMTQAEKIAFFS